MLRAAAHHPGAALIEIYQNCPVFNDGAFAALTEKEAKDANQIRLEHGEPDPLRRGRRAGRRARRPRRSGLVEVSEVGEDALLVHDCHRDDPSLAFALARLCNEPTGPTPIGVFRDVERRVYARGDAVAPRVASDADLAELLLAGDTWTVGG